MTKILNHFRLFAGLSLVLSLPAVAQTRYCLGGDLDHLSASQRSACTAKMDAVRKAALGVQVPADWHFVVVCGEQGWKDYAAYAFASSDALENAPLSTDFDHHETFLRESTLRIEDKQSVQQMLAQALTHGTRSTGVSLVKAGAQAASNHETAAL